jgi:hypothetical protein
MSESQALGLFRFLEGECFEEMLTAAPTVSAPPRPWITFCLAPKAEMTLGKIWLPAVFAATTKKVIEPWLKWVGR